MPHGLTLADLIRQHQDATGESYAEIAKRGGLSKAKVGQLAMREQHHMPRVDTVEKLARALRLPLKVVQRAAMASAGITPKGDDDPTPGDVLAARINMLSKTEREIVAVFVDALCARRDTRG